MTKKQIKLAKRETEKWEKKYLELSLRRRDERQPKKVTQKRQKKNKKNKKVKEKIQKSYASYKEYLSSPEWKKIRLRILKRANYKCEVCKIMKAYQVHHKTYKRIFNEKDTDLIAICGTCHQDKHKILTDEQIEKRVNKLMQKEGYK